VWILDLASRTLKQVTSGSWQIAQIEWLPSGDRLVAAVTAKPASDQWNQHLYAINIGSGEFTEIAAPRGPLGAFALSPDGKTIAYVGARLDGPDAHDLFLQSVGGGSPRNITAAEVDRPISQLHWVDAQTLAATLQRGFKSEIALITADRPPATVTGIETNPSAFAWLRMRWPTSARRPRGRPSCGSRAGTERR